MCNDFSMSGRKSSIQLQDREPISQVGLKYYLLNYCILPFFYCQQTAEGRRIKDFLELSSSWAKYTCSWRLTNELEID